MPFTKEDAHKYKEGLTDKQAEDWAKIANGLYGRCRLRKGSTEKQCTEEAIRRTNMTMERPFMKNIFIGQAFDLGRTAPREIQIFPRGQWRVPGQKQRFDFNDKFFDEVIANFLGAGNEVVIDYDHSTELASPGDRAVAAGWISGLVKKTDGLWAVIKEWTDTARKHIEAAEYKYLSPAWTFKFTDPRSNEMEGALLTSVALTNTPYFVGMEPLFASKSYYSIEKEEEEMDLKKFAVALGLAEDASEDDILKAVEAAGKKETTKAVASKEVLEVMGLSETATVEDFKKAMARLTAGAKDKKDEGPILARLDATEKKMTSLEKEFAESKATLARKDCEALVDLGIKEGKVYPYEREELVALASEKPEHVKKLIEKRPVVVPLKERIAGGPGPKGKEGEVVITAAQREINKSLGVSAEAFRKHWDEKNKEEKE